MCHVPWHELYHDGFQIVTELLRYCIVAFNSKQSLFNLEHKSCHCNKLISLDHVLLAQFTS
jgi:hypothetical protein